MGSIVCSMMNQKTMRGITPFRDGYPSLYAQYEIKQLVILLIAFKVIDDVEHRFAHVLQGIAVPVEFRRMADDGFIAVDADVIEGTGDGSTEVGEVFRAGTAFQGNQVDPVCTVVL